MGLAEKRVAAAMEKESFPGWKKKVLAAADGAKLSFDVKWADLVKEGYAESYPDAVQFTFFDPLAKALENVCSDDMGRDAFKETIKTVKITSTRSWSSLEVKISGDTLHLDADPSYSRKKDDCAEYYKRIQDALEAAL